MVKTPKMRHSKSRRDPVTIELEPGAVSRIADENAAKAGAQTDEAKAEEAANASQPEAPEEPVHADQTDLEPWEHAEATARRSDRSAESARKADEPAAAYPGSPDDAAGKAGAFDYSFEDASAKRAEPDPAGPVTGASAGNGKTASAPPPPPKRVNGIAAGIIGGVIALVGAGGLQFAGLLGAPGSGASVSLEGVNGEIAALRTEIADLKQAGDGGASAKVDSLSAALDQVRTDVAALKSAAEQGGAGDNAGLAALGDKVRQIETAVGALGKAGNPAPVDLGPLNERLAGLDALVKSAGEAAAKQDGRLTALEQSVAQLSGKVEAQAGQPKVALAIAASALKAALDRGAPFGAELETFAAIAPDAPQLAALRAYAQKGVQTRTEIASQMDAAANAMVAAATPVDENAGLLQNLLSSAESLVKVRPIGAVQGAGAPETIARMEVAVNQGDYAKALTEYETLPAPAKAAGADFAGKLKARIEVETLIDALISGAMKA
ncbi:COG4223 family protein [Mesorhizobium sp. BR1-1-9]|uniref:mitofilin family membrane protein n=1 Tax=unclassified Mesorhizobium TaxID=325217 RepID=UPI00112AC623|nr:MULTISPECIES: mitofilin family membrane protein [unclassified Mesorhizobium]MBZ9806651.1 COG4223 family protein [Mesorhizobium sp. ESP-6-2]MBZ9870599.1 COG4223 family protein [Mesorhizobium sp. BR1-1-9]MBZ9939844.1 COG4223 family protein [Mesorhizobium sp. BR1-1-13]TPM24493.1 phage tail protein [Mesorhizobium sp. B2-2-2]